MVLQNYIEKIRELTFKKHIYKKILQLSAHLDRDIGRRWILLIPCDSCNPDSRIWLHYQVRNHNVSDVIYSFADSSNRQQWNIPVGDQCFFGTSSLACTWRLPLYHPDPAGTKRHYIFPKLGIEKTNTKTQIWYFRKALTWLSTTACTVALVTTGLPMYVCVFVPTSKTLFRTTCTREETTMGSFKKATENKPHSKHKPTRKNRTCTIEYLPLLSISVTDFNINTPILTIRIYQRIQTITLMESKDECALPDHQHLHLSTSKCRDTSLETQCIAFHQPIQSNRTLN